LASIACFSNIPDELYRSNVCKNYMMWRLKISLETKWKIDENLLKTYCTAREKKKLGTKCYGLNVHIVQALVPFMMRLFSAGKLLKLITIPNVSQQCYRDWNFVWVTCCLYQLCFTIDLYIKLRILGVSSSLVSTQGFQQQE
jgi:hypothetical protein